MRRNAYTVWAKLWGINELEFIDEFETLKGAAAAARRDREQYPDDMQGAPVQYLVRKEPPPESGIPYEQLAAAGMA
jgi:hypothetical protein